MKQGRTLQDIASELQRQAAARKDYIAAQGALEAKVVEGEVVLDGFNGNVKTISPFAHSQLRDHLAIPAKYYDRMKAEQPELLATNINTWFKADPDDRRMVRTLDDRVRGFLSSKFRPLDNFDLASATLPTLFDRKVEIVSAELTDTRLYLKGILPDLSDELPAGLQLGQGHAAIGRGTVVAAVVISNSDVGAGTLRVEPSVFTTSCTNLMVLIAAMMRKYHIGRAWEANEDLSVYRDQTREADDRAFFMKVKDVVVSAFAEAPFRAAVASLRDAGTKEIKAANDLPKVVELATRKLALPEAASGGILSLLAKNGDLTQLGLANAVTQFANDYPDYEGATEFERAGGKILALPPKEWEAISEAA